MHKIIPGVCIFYLAVIAVYYGFFHTEFPSHELVPLFGTKQQISGIVTDDPDRGLIRTQVVVQPKGLHEKILVRLPEGSEISYGDEITFSATLEQPESFLTDTDRTFDYPAYLAVQGIYATTTTYSFEVIRHHQGNRMLEKLFAIKRNIVHAITNILPLPESGLFAGILIGEKSLLPKDVLSDFQIAGLTHMIVLSGYNITIVAVFVMSLFAWMGMEYRARRIGAIATIPLFIVMTGTGASSVRAGIMSVMVFVLQMTTRPQHAFRIILFALTAMVIANPPSLLHDPSLHLSFLAFIGLLYVAPITQKIFSRCSEWYGLRDLISETLAVQLFVLPYIIYMSGRVSALTLFSNIVTVPIVPLIMGAGFAITMMGMIWYPLGFLLSPPITLALSYIIWVAHLVASVSFTTFTIPPIGAGWLVGTYGILVGLLVNYHKNNPC